MGTNTKITTYAVTEPIITLYKTGSGDLNLVDMDSPAAKLNITVLEGNLLVDNTSGLPEGKITVDSNSSLLVNTNAPGIWDRYYHSGRRYSLEPANNHVQVTNIDDVIHTTYANNGASNGLWTGDNNTFIFTTDVNIANPDGLSLQFFKNFDDDAYISLTKLDGSGNLTDEKYEFFAGFTSAPGNTAHHVNGWHQQYDAHFISDLANILEGNYRIDLRVSQGNGGVGPHVAAPGIGVRLWNDDRVDTVANRGTFEYLKFSDNYQIDLGSGLVISALNLPLVRTIETDIEILGNNTFTVSAQNADSVCSLHLTGEISGSGTLALDSGAAQIILSGENSAKLATSGNITIGTSASQITLFGDTYLTFADGASGKPDLDLAGHSLRILGDREFGKISTSEVGGTLEFFVDPGNLSGSTIFADSVDLAGLTFEINNTAGDAVDLLELTFPLLSAGTYYNGSDTELDKDGVLAALATIFGSLDEGMWSYTYNPLNGLIGIGPNDDNAVPEPATWGMMLLAVGGLMVARRRFR